MNTTWHWRAFSTNLLSVEFLNLVRAHLNPGGIIFYNTTFSNEVQRTGATISPYAYKFINCLIVSDFPITIDTKGLTQILNDYKIDSKPVLNLTKSGDKERLREILKILSSVDQKRSRTSEMESRDHILERTKGLGMVTDDNMLTEWRR